MSFLACCCCCKANDVSPTSKTSQKSAISPKPKISNASKSIPSTRWSLQTYNRNTNLYHNHIESYDTNSNQTDHEYRNILIDDRYIIGSQLGSGSFGNVYHGHDIHTDLVVAVKILNKPGHQSYYRETNILKHLKGTSGIPQIFWKGKVLNKDILIVTRLGHDLSMLYEYCNQSFSVQTVLKLGEQLIKLIKEIHNQGVVHRDIKPHNFLIGYNDKRHDIFIIDFGLAKFYVEHKMKPIKNESKRKDKNVFRNQKRRSNSYSNSSTSSSILEWKHIKCATNLLPVGTARYASLNTHKGISQSRRDDLESIIFVLIYFLKGRLPWQGLKIESKYEKWKKIGRVKYKTHISYLCTPGIIPKQFITYLKYVRKLQFMEKPNYDYLMELFVEAGNDINVDLDKVVWDWEKEESDTSDTTVERIEQIIIE